MTANYLHQSILEQLRYNLTAFNWQGEVRIVDMSSFVGIPTAAGYDEIMQNVDGIILRGADGSAVDKNFYAHYDAFQGKPIGIYNVHYVSSNQGNNKAQAQVALSILDKIGAWPKLNCYADYEASKGALSIVEMRNGINKWLLTFDEGAGHYTDIYSNAWWDTNVANATNGNTDIPNNHRMWAANYRGSPPPYIAWDWRKVGGKVLTTAEAWAAGPSLCPLWQYSNKLYLGGVNLDASTFNGTREQFAQFFKLDGAPPPPPPPTPEPQPDPIKPIRSVTVNTSVLNARGGPGTNYADLGNVTWGDVLPVTEDSPDGQWQKHEFWTFRGLTK